MNFNFTFSDVEWSWLPKCFAITIFTQLPKQEKVSQVDTVKKELKELQFWAIFTQFQIVTDSMGSKVLETFYFVTTLDLSIEILYSDFLQ